MQNEATLIANQYLGTGGGGVQIKLANHAELERVHKSVTSKNITVDVFNPILNTIEPKLQELFSNFQSQRRVRDKQNSNATGDGKKKKAINKLLKGFGVGGFH